MLFTASKSDLKHLRYPKGGTDTEGGTYFVHAVASHNLLIECINFAFYSIKSDLLPEIAKRGNLHWGRGVDTVRGECTLKLVLIYSLSRPTLLFTASKSDLKHLKC